MSKKKKRDREDAPVATGHDDRGEERQGGEKNFKRKSDAPDGVSGNWS